MRERHSSASDKLSLHIKNIFFTFLEKIFIMTIFLKKTKLNYVKIMFLKTEFNFVKPNVTDIFQKQNLNVYFTYLKKIIFYLLIRT